MANLSPFGPNLQYEDSAGEPAVGFRIFFYVNNSVGTKQDTYTTAAGTVANSNPITLNALGQPPNGIFFPAGTAYTIQYAPPGSDDPPNSPIWTRNDVYGVNDASATQDQWVAFSGAPTYVSATSFTLSGDQTSTFQVGRRLKTTNSGGTVYSTIISSSYSALTTVVVANDSGSLDSGLSAVSYGLLSADSNSLPAIVQMVGASSGRLTLTSGTPVLTSDVTGATTVYFTPYNGNTVPIYDGGKFLQVQFTELSQATTDSTKSPASVTTNSNYDLFVWNDAGTLRCTRGPAWSSSTSRGTGAGTTELELVKGVYLNKVAITNGPAANRGTYVGTVRSNGSSQIDWKLGGAGAGGSAAVLGVFNMYNAEDVLPSSRDTTDSWTYSSTTLRQANNNAGNQISAIIGWPRAVEVNALNQSSNNAGSEQGQACGIGVNSTTTDSSTIRNVGISTAVGNPSGIERAEYTGFPGVGYYTFARLEAGASSGTTTFIGDGGGTTAQTGISGRFKQ